MAMNLNQEKDPVARFMQDNRHEVPDDGFTERVMQQLPRRYERIALTLRVVGIVLAVVLFVALGGVEVATGYCKNIYHSLLTGDWDNTQLHSLLFLITGLTVAGICNLSMQKE